VSAFDDHRVDGKCVTAGQMARKGLHEVRPGVWGRPTENSREKAPQGGKEEPL
jgi:hypothetical protein